ncbi:hypothetical protein V474_22940 [Novosphingobium barchaimii LL02]|uniref:Uncharacterized protein n=1 Tax=Novosphingobium barchaimii LL02 TaxID=1114963 RepID=A0A0J8AFG4_9SPHN|nr:hypothetical protein V474_22940 [Novosphingobium barchaimii LL02]
MSASDIVRAARTTSRRAGWLESSNPMNCSPTISPRRPIACRAREVYKATGQFGGELNYFSDRILKGRAVEPDGEEGLANLLVIASLAGWSRSKRWSASAASIPMNRNSA